MSTSSYTRLLPAQRPDLGWRTRITFGAGHVLNDLCASMWFTYLLVYFNLVLKFESSLSGTIMLVGQVADGLATPFVGLEIDASGHLLSTPSWFSCSGILTKLGPRKTWHLFGSLCVIISFPFTFLPCVGCAESAQWAQVIYYSSFIAILQVGWAAAQISHLSLIPVLATDERSRTQLTATRFGFTVASNITIYILTWVALGLAGDSEVVIGPYNIPQFRNVALFAIGIGAIFTFLFHFGVDEVQANQNFKDESNKRTGPSPTPMTALDWFKEKQFYQVAGLYMSTRLFFNLSQVYLSLWLQESLQLESTTVATTPLALYVSGFLTSLVIGRLTQFAGRKIIYLIGALIGIGACAYVWFGSGDFFLTYGIYIVASIFGVGGSTMLITSLAVTADMIGPNVESGAFVYGAMSFTDKLSCGLAVFVIEYLHPSEGNIGPFNQPYYISILSFVCGGSAILSLISLATLAPYKIGVLPKGYQPIPDSSGDDYAAAILSKRTPDNIF